MEFTSYFDHLWTYSCGFARFELLCCHLWKWANHFAFCITLFWLFFFFSLSLCFFNSTTFLCVTIFLMKIWGALSWSPFEIFFRLGNLHLSFAMLDFRRMTFISVFQAWFQMIGALKNVSDSLRLSSRLSFSSLKPGSSRYLCCIALFYDIFNRLRYQYLAVHLLGRLFYLLLGL